MADAHPRCQYTLSCPDAQSDRYSTDKLLQQATTTTGIWSKYTPHHECRFFQTAVFTRKHHYPSSSSLHVQTERHRLRAQMNELFLGTCLCLFLFPVFYHVKGIWTLIHAGWVVVLIVSMHVLPGFTVSCIICSHTLLYRLIVCLPGTTTHVPLDTRLLYHPAVSEYPSRP